MGVGGRRTDRRTGRSNHFAPSTFSKLGHFNALMYKLCRAVRGWGARVNEYFLLRI